MKKVTFLKQSIIKRPFKEIEFALPIPGEDQEKVFQEFKNDQTHYQGWEFEYIPARIKMRKYLSPDELTEININI